MEMTDFLLRHVGILCASYTRLTGRELVNVQLTPQQQVEALDAAPFAVVSHGTQSDPIFNYANLTALTLFEMDWSAFTRLPSRLSAEPLERSERERLLARVTQDGFVDDYSGVRISASGRRFRIDGATVWNLHDEHGRFYGQAALLSQWRFL
jgi:hypothetical protein